MKLSILIPTLPERGHHLQNIQRLLCPQLTDEVEIIYDDRPRAIATGIKRNDMIARASGEWVCSVDDDDEVSSTYVADILEALKSNPDCVTFEGWMTTNGGAYVQWIIKLGEKYEARTDPDGVTRYYRFPNHLVPIRKSIAERVKFPPIWQGEDYQWAVQIQQFLKTSVHIPKLRYHYKFVTNK